MSNFMYFTVIGALGGTVTVPTTRRNFEVDHFLSFALQAYADDPIGNFLLTLTNVVTGSAIQIESQDGTTTLHNSTASGSTVVINLSAYAGGSNLNNLRIKVRKGSAAPFYQPYTTFTTAIVGAQSIYVNQLPDQR